ncbi:PREDICTED: dual oxidase maturation factor 1-like isoform X2 [Vollenhovia emeryi]|uniref:dual oxidase maturation factor 1-like isoform X2 n=1 Tax=Vollenhovia emeryi TaxID=411798 RepID=UPI0005F3FB6C|nr:PREDICTED: dual oxidase maturation factor 1-like isoform X2 [Vollenhovia emeryi]
MGFQFGRSEGFPSQYSAHHTPVTVDVTETILIAVFVIIAIAYISVIPGYRKRQSIYITIKIGFSIVIGCFLIVENFGQEWEYGSTRSKTPYRAGIGQEINAQMAVKIGLRSVNITLKAKPREGTPLAKETIDYNERFPWTWDQGRIGFGPYAGLLQRTFREGQRKGLPIPILWIAEYFVIDGEGIRFGRFYRTAGWYCHILLWTAFACWILANIFLQSVSRYAAYLIGLIGGLQLLTCLVWVYVHNPTPLVIPFEDGVIRMTLGMHFWMTFGCGLFCVLLAIIMIFMDLRYPNTLSTLLQIDPLGQYDECVMRSCQVDDVLRRKVHMNDSMEMTSASSQDGNTGMMVLKRRSTIKNAQKSRFRAPVPMKMEIYDDVAIYENQDMAGSSKNAPMEVHNEKKKEETDVKPPPIPKKKKKKISPLTLGDRPINA